jgi:hypothetical protein
MKNYLTNKIQKEETSVLENLDQYKNFQNRVLILEEKDNLISRKLGFFFFNYIFIKNEFEISLFLKRFIHSLCLLYWY